MNMDFTEEQNLLRASVRRSCARFCGLDVVRKLENDPVGYAPQLWRDFADLGVVGLTLPESAGGSGMTMLDAAMVYEELGAALVPSPHFVSSVLAAGFLARVGKAGERWLPGIAAGETVATVGWLEPDGGFGPEGVRLSAVREGATWRLSGTKRHVPFARAATVLLVLARAAEGPVVAVVSADAGGLALEQELSMASDTQYRLRLTDVQVPAADVIPAPQAWAAWHDTMLDGAILLASLAVGGARATLELAIDYAKTREQFGQPIGAFQSIAHYLADASTAVDGAQTLAWEAAWARTEGRPVDRLAPMAKLFAGRTFRDVTATAQQIFGGMGFTVDCDVQLYFRRAKALQLNYWDDRHLEELIAADVLGAASAG